MMILLEGLRYAVFTS